MVVQFVTRQHEPGVTVMNFTGQLTWGNSLVEAEYAIKDRIQGGSRKLVLDLTNVNFLDSAGVGMLVVCSSVMQQAGGRLVVAGAAGRSSRCWSSHASIRSLGSIRIFLRLVAGSPGRRCCQAARE